MYASELKCDLLRMSLGGGKGCIAALSVKSHTESKGGDCATLGSRPTAVPPQLRCSHHGQRGVLHAKPLGPKADERGARRHHGLMFSWREVAFGTHQ